MKASKILVVLLLIALLTAACGGEAEPAPTVQSDTPAESSAAAAASIPDTTLAEDFEDALTIKNQLILGTIRLEGTEKAVTADQAKMLLPLWQAYRSLTASGTAATEETEAIQQQILDELSPEQVTAIAALQLTNENLQTYYVEIGVAEEKDPTLTPEVVDGGVPMKDLSPEAKATAQAERGIVPSSSGRGTIMMDKIVELLEAK